MALVDRPEQGTTIWRITDSGSKLIGSNPRLAGNGDGEEEDEIRPARAAPDEAKPAPDEAKPAPGDADPAPVGSRRQKLGE